ncbi:MAG: 2-oxoglutarate dehydrogenase E1 component, partial [Tepidisphaeraceae bacterium]
VLAHVLNKPYEIGLSEFEGTGLDPEREGDGDVKYHLGYANTRPLPQGKAVKVSLLPNPSHLELIDPIQQGIVRAQQSIFGDTGRGRVVPITMHGDAAFTGQGIVSETLNLSELHGYRTGGTIHIIINNQIGFTTSPQQGRFTPYPTDVAKMIQAPIFHVNGDDPEAVFHAAKLAIGFRQRFKQDSFIDLWCYRRHGHNETDEPSYTQPVMYREIEQHPSVRTLYAKKLLESGKITQAELDEMRSVVIGRLESAQKLAKEVRPRQKIPSFHGVWKGLGKAGKDWSAETGVAKQTLHKIADLGTRVPSGFTVHPKLTRMLRDRRESVTGGKGIDWGTAEMLALGSLLLEGTPVRFTGQDVERGTFSHRHAVLHDYNTGEPYIPLKNLAPEQGSFHILNTMLSEFAVFGFEWGLASADPRRLVIWEAQFGDFVNGAQPMIDQILATAESKWRYMNGIVMNLPHGYEGQGPEHSNAYLERFLALCADENMQIVYPSLPSQYFHALRRQIRRKFRKPLVFMKPKALLRFEPGTSKIDDFIEGTGFQLVIDDPAPFTQERAKIRRLILCSGKVFFTLSAAREKESITDTAIVRIEQLYPYAKKEIQAILAKYRATEEIIWVQEEPQNRGAWMFMEPRLRELLPETAVLNYVGREAAASPATGIHKMHIVEEQEIISHALDLQARRAKAQATVGAKHAGAGEPGESEAAKAPATSSPHSVTD